MRMSLVRMVGFGVVGTVWITPLGAQPPATDSIEAPAPVPVQMQQSEADADGAVVPDASPEAIAEPVAAEHAAGLQEQAADGPSIELAPETVAEPARVSAPSVDAFRGLRDARIEEAEEQGTVIGGYGELHYNLVFEEDVDGSNAQLDLHRLVVFLAHQFDEAFRFYAELEVEHALSGDGKPGQVGVEQAFVDWKLLGDSLGLRAGIVLVPMGIVNQWHEPPIFNGVERPQVARVVIPSTWREGGIGVFGEPTEGVRYEAYLVGGLNPMRFSTGSGLRGGRQAVAEAAADGPALMARVEVEPTLGVVAGVSGYASLAGGNMRGAMQVDPTGATPVEADLDVPVVGGSIDGRVKMSGFEARAVAAYFSIGDTDKVAALVDDAGVTLGLSPPSGVLGAYGEVGFDVLTLVDCEQALVPFARFEYYDTTFGHEDEDTEGTRATTDMVFGVSYRPIETLVFKGDVILRNPDTGGSQTRVNLGVGWMF